MDVAVTSCEYFSAVMVGVHILYFSNCSHVVMWEWSVESACESGQVVFVYG